MNTSSLPTTPDSAGHSDIVVVGGGAAGLAASLAASAAGASVTIVEETSRLGGHALLSGGWVSLGGGHSLQKKLGVRDSARMVADDWLSSPESRYDSPEMVDAFAGNSADTFEFLLDNGVRFTEKAHEPLDGQPSGAPRLFRGEPVPGLELPGNPEHTGRAVIGALTDRIRDLGVRVLLRHEFLGLTSSTDVDGLLRTTGITVRTGDTVTGMKARAVILATGGHSTNTGFRRMFDPRLGPAYQVVGEHLSRQSGAAEMAGLRVGAALAGVLNQASWRHMPLNRPRRVGCRWGYRNLAVVPGAPLFEETRARGIDIPDWRDVIVVGGRGVRFHDETDDSPAYVDAAVRVGTEDPDPDSSGPGETGHLPDGEPVWAVFDHAYVTRHNISLEGDAVDRDGFFFSAPTPGQLAEAIRPRYGRSRIDAETLQNTVDRYNAAVRDSHCADEFGKTGTTCPIAEPPFYAAWATPILHDSLTGLRTTGRGEVLTWEGTPVPGLYAAGEAQGGFSQHGLGRAFLFGRLAGLAAVASLTNHLD